MANILLTLDNESTIEIELYEDLAPKTAANFLKLVSEGFLTA